MTTRAKAVSELLLNYKTAVREADRAAREPGTSARLVAELYEHEWKAEQALIEALILGLDE